MDRQANIDQPTFAAISLTLTGVIEGAVFGVLATRLAGMINLQQTLSWEGLSEIDRTTLLLLIASIITVIVVTTRYALFVYLFRRRIRGVDVAFPFLLGLVQFAVTQAIENPTNWWLLNGIFCAAAFVAFGNSLTYPIRETFPENQEAGRVIRRNLIANLAQMLVAGGLCFFAAFQSANGQVTFWEHLAFVILFFLVGAFTVTRSRVVWDAQTGEPKVIKVY